jgi:hypothetical protein
MARAGAAGPARIPFTMAKNYSRPGVVTFLLLLLLRRTENIGTRASTPLQFT